MASTTTVNEGDKVNIKVKKGSTYEHTFTYVDSSGAALNAAGSAGDPWTTPLPGAYGAGTAGNIVGNNLNDTVSSRSTLDAAGVRTAVGMAGANLDTQLADIPTVAEMNARTLVAANYFDPTVDAVIVGTNNDKSGYALSSAGVQAIWDHVVEGTTTAVQAVRGMFAALLNKLSGAATTTVTIRDQADTKNRITATVDASGNRTAVTTDLT